MAILRSTSHLRQALLVMGDYWHRERDSSGRPRHPRITDLSGGWRVREVVNIRESVRPRDRDPGRGSAPTEGVYAGGGSTRSGPAIQYVYADGSPAPEPRRQEQEANPRYSRRDARSENERSYRPVDNPKGVPGVQYVSPDTERASKSSLHETFENLRVSDQGGASRSHLERPTFADPMPWVDHS